MKKFLRLSMLTIMTFLSVSLMAKEVDFSISIGEVTSKTIHFKVENAKNISLFLYNDFDSEVYAEKNIKSDLLTKSYDMGNLEMGDYFLVAVSDQKIERYKIVIDSNGVQMGKTPMAVVTKPEFKQVGNKVTMKIEELVGDVLITVTDFSNTEFYRNTKSAKDGNLNMLFDLNPNTSKQYIINVEKNGNIFSKIVSF